MSTTPRNIKFHQLAEVKSEDVVPGDVLFEGIVLEANPDPAQGVYLYVTPYATAVGTVGGNVTVLCRVAPEVVEAVRDALEKEHARG